MTDMPHLSEEERQTLADGSMPTDRARDVESHLRACASCAEDVSRLERLMTRISENPAVAAPTDELWPSIRTRIEQSKIIPLASAPAGRRRSLSVRHFAAVAGLVAAGAVLAMLLRPSHRIPADEPVNVESPTAMLAVVDSVHSYEEEARTLLNRLELHRAMLRPEAAAAIDRNLRSIDQAIAELEAAIDSDPRNPALRRLLAQSYRHKIDILRKSDNAD